MWSNVKVSLKVVWSPVAETKLEVKIRSYTARYPVFRTVHSTLPFTPRQTCSFQHHLTSLGSIQPCWNYCEKTLREGLGPEASLCLQSGTAETIFFFTKWQMSVEKIKMVNIIKTNIKKSVRCISHKCLVMLVIAQVSHYWVPTKVNLPVVLTLQRTTALFSQHFLTQWHKVPCRQPQHSVHWRNKTCNLNIVFML